MQIALCIQYGQPIATGTGKTSVRKVGEGHDRFRNARNSLHGIGLSLIWEEGTPIQALIGSHVDVCAMAVQAKDGRSRHPLGDDGKLAAIVSVQRPCAIFLNGAPEGVIHGLDNQADVAGRGGVHLGPGPVCRRIVGCIRRRLKGADVKCVLAHQPTASGGRQAQRLACCHCASIGEGDACRYTARCVTLNRRVLGRCQCLVGCGSLNIEGGGMGCFKAPAIKGAEYIAFLNARGGDGLQVRFQ